VRATNDLLGAYQHVIGDLRIVTGANGVFDVTVNGDLLYSKHETGRHAEDGEILELFRGLIGPDIDVYGD